MPNYNVFIDKVGFIFKPTEDLVKAKELYAFALEQKERKMDKFVSGTIYLMEDNKKVLMSDEAEKMEMGGEMLEYNLQTASLNRFVNGYPAVEQESKDSASKYAENTFSLRDKKSFVQAVEKNNGIFVILKGNINDDEKVIQIKECLEKQVVPYKIN